MNFMEIDNTITLYLYNNIELYQNAVERYNNYKEIDPSNVGGRLYNDILRDLKFIEELKFSENILVLYKKQTSGLMSNFLKIMKTPIKKDNLFELKMAEKNKKKILHDYLSIIKTCIPHEVFNNLNLWDENSIDLSANYCENCGNKISFIKENDVLICGVCFAEVIKMAYYNNRSYNVTVNKCNYDRMIHFKECIKQYQGKQNTFISPDVYTNIENALYTNGIIGDPSLDRTTRFQNVKKNHIMYFLKELGYSKHYDDYALIHCNMTNKKPNDISYIEDKLIADFEKISEKYLTLNSNLTERKNFINIQFILYCLLIKHNHKFDKEDFSIIKSIDGKIERDKRCKNIFESLGWDYRV